MHIGGSLVVLIGGIFILYNIRLNVQIFNFFFNTQLIYSMYAKVMKDDTKISVPTTDLDTMWTQPHKHQNKVQTALNPKIIYNMSIVDISKKVVETLLDIMKDITEFKYESKTYFTDIVHIFLRDDRLLYLGIFSILIAIILFCIYTTSENKEHVVPQFNIKIS
tara:strand:- start:42 stop:533 length:492 start_codon:yes stop_codon:yes gene_type:complete